MITSNHAPSSRVQKTLKNLGVRLGKTEKGFVPPEKGAKGITVKLSDIPGKAPRFSSAAIRRVCSKLVDAFNRKGLSGVYVSVSGKDIAPRTGKDRRSEDRTLTLVVSVARVGEVRTVAAGERIPDETKINSRAHAWIRESSPVQEGDPLWRSELKRYVYRLSRHPGRRADVQISASEEAGRAQLDYRIAESKPWTAYFQLSNTGTEQTDEWRERFGLVHNQLTGHDDTLRVDYVTASFDEAHAVSTSYEFPIKRLCCDLRVYGSWNEFTASEVGGADEGFEGESWQAGAEGAWNVFQHRQLFVDLLSGARWQNIEVTNNLFNIRGYESFFLPYAGLELERNTRRASTSASIDVETNLHGAADTNTREIASLGRLNTTKDWTAMHWNASHSFFVEPLIYGDSWKNPETPETSTLAHELSFQFQGQKAFGDRLIPQSQGVIGGTYTVRGYPESVVAGDDVAVARAEYRYHVPRAFKPTGGDGRTTLFGRPFQYAPRRVFGRPDWDLVLKAFFDWGRAENNYPTASEDDATLKSAGLGVELDLWRNLHLRCEWGHTLEALEGEGIQYGHDRVHVGATVLW